MRMTLKKHPSFRPPSCVAVSRSYLKHLVKFHKEKEIHLPTTFLRLFKKDTTFYHLHLFLDPVIRLIICLAICPVVHQVIWCFTVDSLVLLIYPMAVFSANFFGLFVYIFSAHNTTIYRPLSLARQNHKKIRENEFALSLPSSYFKAQSAFQWDLSVRQPTQTSTEVQFYLSFCWRRFTRPRAVGRIFFTRTPNPL